VKKRRNLLMAGEKKHDLKQHARAIFAAALEAVRPAEAVKRNVHLVGEDLKIGRKSYSLSQYRGIYVIGMGKAGASMASAIEDILGDRLAEGIVIVKYGYTAPLRLVRLYEAGHPIPDQAGLAGAREIASLADRTGSDDLVLCLISGGGSALLPLPAEGVSLADKQQTTKLLLECGATINEINALRKHLSAIKGGQLARRIAPAESVSLILSDVIGDDLDVIASGPTVPDGSTFADCARIIDRYGLSGSIPSAVADHLRRGTDGAVPETPKAGDPFFERTSNLIIGSNIMAVRAAEARARELGYHTLILSTFIEGETRDVARVHSAIAREILSSGSPVPKPACVISGGETTVTIQGDGKGGRNQEFALAGAIEIGGFPDVCLLSGGTDGTDGPTDAAGAVADGRTVSRGARSGLSAADFLDRNDSYHYFEPLGDLLMTGPTNTNVMDVRIMLVS